MKNYEEFYTKGGFRYNIAHQRRWVENNTTLFSMEPGTTLLDAGCGDGFWSLLLSSNFKVTGIDLSEAGIKKAQESINKSGSHNVEFYCGNVLEHENIYDVVFCRAPSFLNLSSTELQFEKNIEKLFSLCSRELYYISACNPPYERWAKSNYFNRDSDGDYYNSQWYYHDPSLVKKCFGRYGTPDVKTIGGYLVARLLK